MKNNQLRIIGGEWRSRRLSFPNVPGLRPTPDRMRETLFNWLQGHIAGSRCLDLFAGSGALGLEALSRGAAEVVFIEKHPAAVKTLRNNLELLGATQAQLVHNDALRYLSTSSEPFDFIFLDPPFHQQLIPPVLTALLTKGLLKPTGMLYLEQEIEATNDFANFGLLTQRRTAAGQTQSFLLKINNNCKMFSKDSDSVLL